MKHDRYIRDHQAHPQPMVGTCTGGHFLGAPLSRVLIPRGELLSKDLMRGQEIELLGNLLSFSRDTWMIISPLEKPSRQILSSRARRSVT